MLSETDLRALPLDELMRRAFDLAHSSRAKGNHPFGALLADASGAVVLESENTVGEMGDVTCHAEQNLISAASRKFTRDDLAGMVMVTSTEPCAMCSGATFWAGVRAVVYGLPMGDLHGYSVTPDNPTPASLNVPCRSVFAGCPAHPTTVIGPVLREEAAEPHAGFWGRSPG